MSETGWQPRAEPIVVPLSTPEVKVKTGLGTLVLLFFGALGAYGAISGNLSGVPPLAGRIISGCIALLFLGLGVPMLVTLPLLLRSRSFVVDGRGIRYVDPKGRAWDCAWTELSELRLETAYRRTRIGGNGRVRMIMHPADPGFAGRHRSMSAFAGRYGAKPGEFSMPLGPNVDMAEDLDAAISTVNPPCYAGIIDTGKIIGLRGYV